MQPEKADVLPFLRQSDEMLFTAPSNYHKLQADESLQVLRLAQHIADIVCNRELAELPRKAQAQCRRLASHDLRMMDRNMAHAALSDALKACEQGMRDAGGKAFRDLPDRHIEALAAYLVPLILTAFHNITEGTAVLEPGRYLAIKQGRGL